MFNIKNLSILFLFFTLSAKAQIDFNPRKLTVSEVKSNPELQLDDLLSQSDKPTKTIEREQLPALEAAVPLSHLPKGTNMEAGPKDAIRMPGTNWCGKGWRADSAKSMGGYAGADRLVVGGYSTYL